MAGDKFLERAFDRLPEAVQNNVTLIIVGVVVAVLYFTAISTPLAQATETNASQSEALKKQQETIDKLTLLVGQIAQTQAVQATNIANLKEDAQKKDAALERINDKLDRLLTRTSR